MIITIVAFIIVLGVLIFFHELGHFLMCKLSGVMVLKFSLGFGPALLKKKVGETEYMISAIPLGGYVKMLGEGKDENAEALVDADPSRYFNTRPLTIKALIVAAGPVFNLILAFLIYSMFSWIGIVMVEPVIGSVVPDSPAYKAGLLKGDRILMIDNEPIENWLDIPRALAIQGSKINPKEPISIVIERNSMQFKLQVVPNLKDVKHGVKMPVLGIISGDKVYVKRYGPITGLIFGGKQCWKIIRETGKVFGMIFSGEINFKQSLGGPIMIAEVSGETLKSGTMPFLDLIAYISISLALINLLPIPVLDGGYLMIFLIEGIIRRPIKDKPKEIAQQIGLFLLILLMFFVFYNDIMRYFFSK